jgi:hypothetical protein
VKRVKLLISVMLFAGQVSAGLFGQTVEVKVSTSANWIAAGWSLVELEISGASGAGPCRFVQDYPVGFMVRAVDTGSGDLFFDNNRLSIVWSQLPAGDRTSVTFEVMPERALSGMIELSGVLYAVTGAGKRTIVSVPPKSINISEGVAVANERQQVTGKAVAKPETTSRKDGTGDKSAEQALSLAGGVQFRVQVLSSSSRIGDTELKRRLGISFQERVTVIEAIGIYKYQIGECNDFGCAAALLDRFKKSGVSGAFIVAFRGGEQITVEEARSLSR